MPYCQEMYRFFIVQPCQWVEFSLFISRLFTKHTKERNFEWFCDIYLGSNARLETSLCNEKMSHTPWGTDWNQMVDWWLPLLSGFVCAYHPAVPGSNPFRFIVKFCAVFVIVLRKSFTLAQAGKELFFSGLLSKVNFFTSSLHHFCFPFWYLIQLLPTLSFDLSMCCKKWDNPGLLMLIFILFHNNFTEKIVHLAEFELGLSE